MKLKANMHHTKSKGMVNVSIHYFNMVALVENREPKENLSSSNPLQNLLNYFVLLLFTKELTCVSAPPVTADNLATISAIISSASVSGVPCLRKICRHSPWW